MDITLKEKVDRYILVSSHVTLNKAALNINVGPGQPPGPSRSGLRHLGW